MADGQSSLNPTILGRPLFPSMDWIKRSASKISSAIQNAQGEPMMADAGSLNLSAFPVFPKMGPLIRTDYGRAPSERPDFIDPSQQWGARSPTKTAGSAPQPVAPTFLSPEQQGFYNYSRLSPQSQNVVSSVQQSTPTGIAGGAMGGLPDYTRQFPSQIEREPMAPVTAGLGGITARRGVRTAYGMVYPAAGQEAAAQRLAQMSPMGARLAEAGKKLSQEEKIAQMRVLGRQRAIKVSRGLEEEFRRGRLEMQEKRNLEQQRALASMAPSSSRTKSQDRIAKREASKQQQQEVAKSNFVGFGPIGNPIIKIPDGMGGYVVFDEESGNYIPA